MKKTLFLPKPNMGRPRQVVLTQEQARLLGEIYLSTNRTRDAGSMEVAWVLFVEGVERNGWPAHPEFGWTVERESDLRDIRSLARLQLIFDTQAEAANEFGYWKQGNDPAVLDVFPAQRFIRVRPVNSPRPIHAANEGAVRRKDDLAFWLAMNEDFGVPWGPWGFNSGMGVEDVDREEAEELGVLKKGEAVRPVEREFNEGLEAGVKEMDAGILAALARELGGTVAGGVATPRKIQKPEDGKTQETRGDERERVLPRNTKLEPELVRERIASLARYVQWIVTIGAWTTLAVISFPES